MTGNCSRSVITYQACAKAIFLLSILIFGGLNLCLADGVDLAKEKSFGVNNHQKGLNDVVNVFDGFTFHRFANSVTKKIDNSEPITFTYTASYKKIDFSKMTETVISQKEYAGSIAAGKNESFLDLKMLMSELSVKDYTGVIGIKVKDAKGAFCAGSGDAIDLRLVKIALDAAAESNDDGE